jgi:hypothetical protein
MNQFLAWSILICAPLLAQESAEAPKPLPSCVGDIQSADQLNQFFTCLNNKREWCVEQVRIAEMHCGRNSPKFARLAGLYADLRFSSNNLLDAFSEELRNKSAPATKERMATFTPLFVDFQAKTHAFDDCVTNYQSCNMEKGRGVFLVLIAPLITQAFVKDVKDYLTSWFTSSRRERTGYAETLQRQRWASMADPAKPKD